MSDQKSWNGHHGDVVDSLADFDVIDCEPCGFRHVVPIPTPQELEKVYREDYYTKEKPLYIERYQADLDWWNLVYGERYELFESLLPAARRTILDIGSGPGYFLLNGKKRGWQTTGVEPSAQSATHSRELGLAIVEEFFDDVSASNLGSFDVVHMSQVSR
jgi:SAM-dependent methyltransferase